MLGIRLQAILIAMCIIAFIYLFYKMKVRRVDVKYTMPWLLLDVLMLIVAIFPEIPWRLCVLFGIQVVSNGIFFAALSFLLVIVYLLTRAVSRLNNEVRELAQRIALDEAEKVSADRK